jgi:glutathione synthase/RimK-type ligase-like ATP-grasp enzyme
MTFLALATCRSIPEPDDDEALLMTALTDAHVPARVLAWDDDAVDWDEPRLTVIRSTWNYYLRPEPFLAWAWRRGTRLVNAPDVVQRNHHKGYLRDLEATGVPVVPTLWLARGSRAGSQLSAQLGEKGWADIVVKPAVSAGSYKTRRLSGPPFDETLLAELCAAGDTMVQPYVRSVDTYGERSLIYIDGEITHAIRKNPRFHGGFEQVTSVAIADDERALAEQVLERVTGAPLYARVDLVRDDVGRPMLGELELIEPSLFLRQSPAALARFVAAIARRFADAAP